MTELDAETKARIEAEERYRQELRAQAGEPPAASQPVAPVQKSGLNIPKILTWAILLGGGYWLYTLYVANKGPETGTAVGIAISDQDTADNLSKAIYLTATDAAGAEIATTGGADLVINFKPYDGESRQIVSKHYNLSPSVFSKGTRGLGAFKRDAVFVHLDDVPDSMLKQSDSGSLEMQITFTTESGETLQARDSLFVQ